MGMDLFLAFVYSPLTKGIQECSLTEGNLSCPITWATKIYKVQKEVEEEENNLKGESRGRELVLWATIQQKNRSYINNCHSKKLKRKTIGRGWHNLMQSAIEGQSHGAVGDHAAGELHGQRDVCHQVGDPLEAF